MRILTLCAALAAIFATFTPALATPEDMAKLRDGICTANEENWSNSRVVETKRGLVLTAIEHHKDCVLTFVVDGNWYKFEYRSMETEAFSAGVRETVTSSLSLMVLTIDSADAQNLLPFPCFTVEDRKARGQVVFGVRDTYGQRTPGDEHFFRPSSHTDEDGGDGCVAEACEWVGKEHESRWQKFYQDALALAKARLKI